MTIFLDTRPIPDFDSEYRNPAEYFVNHGSLDMAVTEPFLNNDSIFKPHLNIKLPKTAKPTLFNYGQYKWTSRITESPHNFFKWRVQLPVQQPYWESRAVPTDKAIQLLNRLLLAYQEMKQRGKVPPDVQQRQQNFQTFGKLHSGLLRQYDYDTVKFVFYPRPNAGTFYQHIVYHELQHMADHLWITKHIIGRWDQAITTMNVKNYWVLGRDKASVYGLGNLFGYASGVPRIFEYWLTVLTESGNLFHDTPEGDSVIPVVTSVNEKTIFVELHARQLIQNRPGLSLQHVQPHDFRNFALKAWDITGHANRLSYGQTPRFPMLLRFENNASPYFLIKNHQAQFNQNGVNPLRSYQKSMVEYHGDVRRGYVPVP